MFLKLRIFGIIAALFSRCVKYAGHDFRIQRNRLDERFCALVYWGQRKEPQSVELIDIAKISDVEKFLNKALSLICAIWPFDGQCVENSKKINIYTICFVIRIYRMLILNSRTINFQV